MGDGTQELCCDGTHVDEGASALRFCVYKGFTRVTATAHKQVSGQVRSELACSPFKPGATRRFDTGHRCHFSLIACEKDV